MESHSIYFKKHHTKLLLLLVLLDLVATMVWFYFFGIDELNPILVEPINKSLLRFTFFKLLLSLPSIYLFNKYLPNKLAQIGIGISLSAYTLISIIHYYLLINILFPLS
ncbi:hypothetical protein CMI47_00545 [Candidatus Pacearchaeota archaeon]|nr:hypothetical protein [Candidatus Pacearchaeota archaeon]|tara:strand:+ start:1564 stop:1890 length:327 start_codon:yes stop_codon:yes gene_type:complete